MTGVGSRVAIARRLFTGLSDSSHNSSRGFPPFVSVSTARIQRRQNVSAGVTTNRPAILMCKREFRSRSRLWRLRLVCSLSLEYQRPGWKARS